ncbi:MAG: hypothetical protein ACREJO_14550 [Phycisphaerales bacterium]
MTQSPTPLETQRGYTVPSVRQFSIFLPNRVGKMMEMVKGFDEAMCRICGLAVHEASDHAVIRIIPNNAEAARKILLEQELPWMETPVLIVCLDKGHTLSEMCGHLLHAELSIRFSYPLMAWAGSDGAIALAVDDLTLAGQVLRRKEFRLLAEEDLPKYGD